VKPNDVEMSPKSDNIEMLMWTMAMSDSMTENPRARFVTVNPFA